MIYVNATVSIITVLGLCASAFAWRHSLRQKDGQAEWFFAVAKVLLATGIGLRLLMWDIFFAIGTQLHGAVPSIFTALGGVTLNVVSSAIIAAGVYASLRSRQMLIPEPERDGWPWWKAFMHPGRPRRRRT